MKYILWLSFGLLFLSACKEGGKNNEHPYTNALVNETSPYLLQHAHNPVNWYPWGEEALQLAKEEDKLVLVSIGYSSCHWCHVMEEETFEDEEVAKLMNEKFISIKVDREERPDVDQVYMTALQLLTGSGGWPLNVITLPDGKPIYGGTYHTKEEWMQVLDEISSLYQDSPARAREYADKVAEGIQAVNIVEKPEGDTEIDLELLERIFHNWERNWDTIYGGQKGPQKFMLPSNLKSILEYSKLSGSLASKKFVEVTLEQMYRGGIYDHLGGGFYRYSTDREWKVPHFEKMLYDNAQLIGLYSQAYKVSAEDAYKRTVQQTIEFLDREMRHPEGAYFAALDADSEGEEGRFYTWEQEELKQLLGQEYNLFADYYGIQPDAAWEESKYILRRSQTDSAFVSKHKFDHESLREKKKTWKELLMPAREKRVRPGVDDKVITSWNALLITGLTEAYTAFGETEYLQKAEDIYEFLQKHNSRRGKLVHTYKEGSDQSEGFLEDYAYLLQASLDLYQVTLEEKYLETAREYLQFIMDNYQDGDSPMFRFRDDDALISNIIKTDDGVLPSPNAVVATNLMRLGHLDYNTRYLTRAEEMLSWVLADAERSPDLYGRWISNLLTRVYPYYEVAVVGPEAREKVLTLSKDLHPNALIVGAMEESEQPLFENRYVPGETFIYVCQNHSCKLPVTDVEAAIQLMN